MKLPAWEHFIQFSTGSDQRAIFLIASKQSTGTHRLPCFNYRPYLKQVIRLWRTCCLWNTL